MCLWGHGCFSWGMTAKLMIFLAWGLYLKEINVWIRKYWGTGIKLDMSILRSWILFTCQVAGFIHNYSRKPSFRWFDELFSPVKCPNCVSKDKNKHFKPLNTISIIYMCYAMSFFMFKEGTMGLCSGCTERCTETWPKWKKGLLWRFPPQLLGLIFLSSDLASSHNMPYLCMVLCGLQFSHSVLAAPLRKEIYFYWTDKEMAN